MVVERRAPQATRTDSGTPRTDADKPTGARHVIDLSRQDETAPHLQKLFHSVLGQAIEREASDVHIEPCEDRCQIRFRVDGTLHAAMVIPADLREPLVSRIKAMAQLDRGQKRLPQDGRFTIELRLESGAREVEVHAAVLPTLSGEKVVLRLLERSQLPLSLAGLGIAADGLSRLSRTLETRGGLVLVAGPRRSGKTNTIYAAIASLDSQALDVVSVSERTEFRLPGTASLPAVEGTASALKTALARTADVLVTGELGEPETARLALTLASHGRLVFSTVYASDAALALFRLTQLVVDPYAVATSVGLVVAQRLVRRICADCRFDVTGNVPAQALLDLGVRPPELPKLELMAGRGCEACNGSGYRGRVGLFEVLEISEGIQDLILAGARPPQIQTRAIREGMITLRASGLEKIRSGETTLEEVLRHTPLPFSADDAPPPAPVQAAARERAGGAARERDREPRPPGAPPAAPNRGTAAAMLAELSSQLVLAHGETRALRQRLAESDRPHFLTAQLGDARLEIEELRRCLFELNAYRIACELTGASGARPAWSVGGETVAAVQRLLDRGTPS
jgi:type IV pilus assembly protein PilB